MEILIHISRLCQGLFKVTKVNEYIVQYTPLKKFLEFSLIYKDTDSEPLVNVSSFTKVKIMVKITKVIKYNLQRLLTVSLINKDIDFEPLVT